MCLQTTGSSNSFDGCCQARQQYHHKASVKCRCKLWHAGCGEYNGSGDVQSKICLRNLLAIYVFYGFNVSFSDCSKCGILILLCTSSCTSSESLSDFKRFLCSLVMRRKLPRWHTVCLISSRVCQIWAESHQKVLHEWRDLQRIHISSWKTQIVCAIFVNDDLSYVVMDYSKRDIIQ